MAAASDATTSLLQPVLNLFPEVPKSLKFSAAKLNCLKKYFSDGSFWNIQDERTEDREELSVLTDTLRRTKDVGFGAGIGLRVRFSGATDFLVTLVSLKDFRMKGFTFGVLGLFLAPSTTVIAFSGVKGIIQDDDLRVLFTSGTVSVFLGVWLATFFCSVLGTGLAVPEFLEVVIGFWVEGAGLGALCVKLGERGIVSFGFTFKLFTCGTSGFLLMFGAGRAVKTSRGLKLPVVIVALFMLVAV